MRRLLEKANWVTLALCVGVIQFSAYYLLSATVRADGFLAVAQPDTSLYFQAARRIVEGGAFTYSAGGALQTGTTSVLYPFLLAVPYALGLTDHALVGAGFALNAVFYLIFLVGWLQVIDLKVREPIAKLVSALALSLFGQFAFVSLAQSDIGFWLALSSLFAFGLAKMKPWVWGLFLVLAPWVRPEGMVLVIAVALVTIVVRRYRRVALLGLLSVAGVFVLNFLLTGSAQFSSVQGKGHFATESFALAMVSSFCDAVTMLRQLFFGLSSGSFREMFFVPVFGAVCLWFHVFKRDYSDFDFREAIFLLAAAGGFATVATSGMQGTNLDRYLAWLMPVAVIWTACGSVELGRRLRGIARFLPPLLILGFGLAGSVALMCRFRIDCARTEIVSAFAARCEQVLPKDCALGGFGNANLLYWLSPHRFEHLYGIYSPAFKTRALVSAFEILKHEPQRRFDYWLYGKDVEGELVAEASQAVFGETVLAGPMGRELRQVDWSPFDAADKRHFQARVDVGYEADEKAAGYRAYGAFAQRASEPFFRLDELEGRKVAEVGRVVTGGDEMTVSGLVPGQELQIVMRTALRANAERLAPHGRVREDYLLADTQTLQVLIDGESVCSVQYHVPEKGFADVSFKLPATAIRANRHRLTLAGEHITFCYWFYQ